jgi:hypothetical protein
VNPVKSGNVYDIRKELLGSGPTMQEVLDIDESLADLTGEGHKGMMNPLSINAVRD